MLVHYPVMREPENHNETLFAGNPGFNCEGAVYADG